MKIRNLETGAITEVNPQDAGQYGITPDDISEFKKTQPVPALQKIPQQTINPPVNNSPIIPNTTQTQNTSVKTNTPFDFSKSVHVKDEPKSVEGFASNVGKSAVTNAKDIGSGILNIFNPNLEKNTLANLGKLGIDTVKLVAGDKSETNKAKLVGEFYKNRYGSLDKAIETLYTDPVGVALDASVVTGGAGAAVKGLGVITKSSKLAKVANVLTKTSRVVDPIAQASKITGKGLGKVGEVMSDSTKGVRDSASSFLAKHSIKAKPAQVVKFEELTGQELGKFMSDNNVYTLKDATKAIEPIQATYNSMVRTGKKVPGSVFANNLRQKALSMITDDMSPSARQIAEKLWKEADQVDKMTDVTDTILTNSKTSSYNKVSAKAMTDPITDNFNKAYGEVGIQTLDKIAPGSAVIGKKLQAFREFENITKTQSGLGKGSQIFNTLRPGVGGAVIGNLIPGIGTVGGAIIGETVTNPTVQRTASKILQKGLPGGKFISEMADPLYQTAKQSSRLGPISSALPQKSEIGKELPKSTIQEDTYNNNLSQSPQDVKLGQPTYITGNSPEAWMKAKIDAEAAGNDKAAKAYLENYNTEVDNQKLVNPPSKKMSSAAAKDLSRNQTAVRAIADLEKELKDNGGMKILLAATPGSPGARKYRSLWGSIVDTIGTNRTGAAYTVEQRKDYAHLLPVPGDSDATIEFKLQNIKDEISTYTNNLQNTNPDEIILPTTQ